MKKVFALFIIVFTIMSCGSNNSNENNSNGSNETKDTPAATESGETGNTNPSYDPKRGEGRFTQVEVSPTLDAAKATAGEKVYSVKCSSCHKLTDEKLVGPGWKGVTSRHTAEWIMNFSTNPDAMLNKDPKAQAMLEICLVRMPDQNLADNDARDIYEFMRKNDGVK